MKALFLVVISFQILFCNDYQQTCSNCSELTMMEYQKQLNSLTNSLSDTNTNNKLLEQKLADTEKYYSSILLHQEQISEQQISQLKTVLEQQSTNHQDTIDNLFYLFKIIVGIFLVFIGVATYFGRKYLIKIIKNEILSNHIEVTSKLVHKLSEEKEFIRIIKAQISLELKEEEKEEKEENENENEKNEYA